MPAARPLLLHVFSTFAVGGPQVRFTTIANHFGPRWRHAIVAMDGNLAARERLDPALDVSFPSIALPKGDTRGNIHRIRAGLHALAPATLITSNWGTIEWAMANRWPIVRHVHVEDGFGPEERAAQIPRRVWTRRLMLARRTVVVPSLTLRSIALDQWRLNPAHVRYLPNGIDLNRFGPGPAVTWPGEGPIIGTVAALRPEKNLARLLHAFALAAASRPARLVIIGDGPERPRLEALARTLGIDDRTHWAGHITDPAPLLRGLDIFAMSSDTEQMPLSLLEAMATSLPVAATNVGDIAAILPSGQKPYVTALDPAALSIALGRLLDDGDLRATLGQANRARVEAEYSQERMFAGWAELFEG
jgi:glycosyltransferase involved in cell wall biosynthesis